MRGFNRIRGSSVADSRNRRFPFRLGGLTQAVSPSTCKPCVELEFSPGELAENVRVFIQQLARAFQEDPTEISFDPKESLELFRPDDRPAVLILRACDAGSLTELESWHSTGVTNAIELATARSKIHREPTARMVCAREVAG